jgi:hypothetical protein
LKENFRKEERSAVKRGPHQREKKTLSAAGLLGIARKVFEQIPHRRQKNKVSLTDCLGSALAMFSLKSPSLLAFDEGRAEPIVRKNIQALFKVAHVPCDTYMREVLDQVDPQDLRPAFLSIFHECQRSKLLERYQFLGGYLCLVDGTEVFNSDTVHCQNCCQKHHNNGRVTYHHQIVGAVIAKPGLSHVIPLCPEPISKKDGESKNDCERHGFHRFLLDVSREHPRLKLTIVSDALSANAPHIQELTALGYDYIIVAKSAGNRSLFEWVQEVKTERNITVGKNRYRLRYVNDVPLNQTKNTPIVHFLECEWTEIKGRQEKKGYCAWVTSHRLTPENVYEIMQGGRARWKVENETFNTLKNQGYQFEHNFGHGEKNLHTVFAFLMMLAFLIDQVQGAACGLFQAALKSMKRKVRFWERIRSFFALYLLESWTSLFEAIKNRYTFVGSPIAPNTS